MTTLELILSIILYVILGTYCMKNMEYLIIKSGKLPLDKLGIKFLIFIFSPMIFIYKMITLVFTKSWNPDHK